MSNYKELKINGRTIYYRQYWDGHPDDSELNTRFYILEGMKPEKKFSWRSLKRIPTGKFVENYVHKFTLYLDIESSEYTKGQIRKKLERDLELLGREDEIKRGEIV